MTLTIYAVERQILETLRTKVALADDVNLEDIARATDGFTGADLQALVYNANLEAVHETIDQRASNDVLGKGKSSGILDEGQKIQYVTFGPEGSEKKVLSAAEEMAIQRQVRSLMHHFRSETHLRKHVTLQLRQIYLSTSKNVEQEEKAEVPKPAKVRIFPHPPGRSSAKPIFSRSSVQSTCVRC